MQNNFKLTTTVSLLAAAAIGLLSPAANATGAQDRLRSVTIESATQVASIEFPGSWAGRPACHAVFFPGHFAFDISTAKGKALLATAQAALLAGKEVVATGATTCTSVGGGVSFETLTKLTLNAD
jgi:hypothetical protein